MAFVPETGEGLESANAFIDEAFADSYHLERDHAPWAALSSPKKQAAIIRATDFISKRFGHRFIGRKKRPQDQALPWPRVDAYDKHNDLICHSDELPRQLKQATAEYALRAALLGELAPDPMAMVPKQDLSDADYAPPTEFTGGQIRRVGQKVDVIEETKTFNTVADLTVVSRAKINPNGMVTDGNIPEYPAADMLLLELVSTGNRRIRRA